MKQLNTKKLQDNKKSDQQGFIITIEEAREIKFNMDAIRKENKRNISNKSSIGHSLKTIRGILNQAKSKRAVSLKGE